MLYICIRCYWHEHIPSSLAPKISGKNIWAKNIINHHPLKLIFISLIVSNNSKLQFLYVYMKMCSAASFLSRIPIGLSPTRSLKLNHGGLNI